MAKKRPKNPKIITSKTKKDTFHRKLVALTSVLAVLAVGIIIWGTSFAATTVHRKHYIQNVEPRDYGKVVSLGYNVLDVGPSASAIKSLPKGTQGMVWIGNTQCSGFDMKWDKFQDFVKANAKNSKIYGYYISDEPNAPKCSWVAHSIKIRADWIHCLSGTWEYWDKAHKHPKVSASGACLDSKGKTIPRKTNQKAYFVATDFPYKPVRDSETHADIVSLNPYPCRMGRACDYGLIDREFKKAVSAGIGKSKIVPTWQAFGEECNPKKAERNWRTPTASEMKNMLYRWERVFKDNRMTPPMDDTYTWGPSDICPPLSKSSSLQGVLKGYNAKH